MFNPAAPAHVYATRNFMEHVLPSGKQRVRNIPTFV